VKTDLHIHSIYSDGSLSPEEIVDTAIELGISAISITDHDNVLSYPLATAYSEKRLKEDGVGLSDIIPGVEINTIWKDIEVHILGYYMDLDSKSFLDLLKHQQKARYEQTIKIVDRLNKEPGIRIRMEDITSLVMKDGSIGRPHIARALTNTGSTKNVIEAYIKYLNDEAPTYIKRKTVTPHEAIEIIYEAGGIPVVAHPGDKEIIESLIKEFINYGLRGIEVYHKKHSPAMVEYYSTLAEKYGLIVTGGSDFHGPKENKKNFGKNFVPAWVLDALKKEKAHIDIARS